MAALGQKRTFKLVVTSDWNGGDTCLAATRPLPAVQAAFWTPQKLPLAIDRTNGIGGAESSHAGNRLPTTASCQKRALGSGSTVRHLTVRSCGEINITQLWLTVRLRD